MIIDIRPKKDYISFHIPGSVNIPFNNLFHTPEGHLKKEYTYYLICENGYNSKHLQKHLTNLGYHVTSVGSIKQFKNRF